MAWKFYNELIEDDNDNTEIIHNEENEKYNNGEWCHKCHQNAGYPEYTIHSGVAMIGNGIHVKCKKCGEEWDEMP